MQLTYDKNGGIARGFNIIVYEGVLQLKRHAFGENNSIRIHE